MLKIELGDSTFYIPKNKVLYIETHETGTDGYVYKKTYHIDFGWVLTIEFVGRHTINRRMKIS